MNSAIGVKIHVIYIIKRALVLYPSVSDTLLVIRLKKKALVRMGERVKIQHTILAASRIRALGHDNTVTKTCISHKVTVHFCNPGPSGDGWLLVAFEFVR